MYNNKKIVLTIEARMSSTRLPGKVLLPLLGKPALERMIERIKKSRLVDTIVVATTTNLADDLIVSVVEKNGINFFRGSEDDVLSRVLGASLSFGGDIIVELTGDCPLMDWRLVDRGIEEFFARHVDYASNTINPTFPNGFDVQVFSTSVLSKVAELTQDPIDRVHVSYFIYNHPELFKLHNWIADEKCFGPNLRVTLDESPDYELITTIFNELYPKNNDFSAADVVALLRSHPELIEINKYVKQKDVSEG